MAAEVDDKSSEFYAVLGLNRECSAAELRNAYKKLALKWHPDRFSASGNSKNVEDAKKKFQSIQQAYAVLSDANKRFLYDVGFYDCNDDDDENGMGDFLNEMAGMMNQNKSNEKGNETFEDLQGLFDEMFHNDVEAYGRGPSRSATHSTCSSSSQASSSDAYSISNKRNSTKMSSGNLTVETTQFGGFCLGVEHRENTKYERAAEERVQRLVGGRNRYKKQRTSSGETTQQVR